jgi:hypothetical protein
MIETLIVSALIILLFRVDAESRDESAVAGGDDPGRHRRRNGLDRPASTRPATV